MSAKRALILDSVKKNIGYDTTPLKTNVKNLSTYSPTTGTCEMSPFSSPMSHDAQNLKNHLVSGGNRVKQDGSASRLPRRGQSQAEKDVFMELQCKVKRSLNRILNIRANLTSLQALEGSRELENVGVSASSGNLTDEVQKTGELMSQAEEMQLLERDHGKLARRYVQTTGSSVFLKSLLD
ncbi:centromere protein R [Melopsittacus undulatus]|nr:centromere protein R [Melopsittacus undulatus]